MKRMNRSGKLSSTMLVPEFATKQMNILLLVVWVLLVLAYPVHSADNDDSSNQSQGSSKPPPFEYQLENRPDPFAPFITEKAAAASVDMNEIIDNTEPLTGMQLFEPGQLTLVALLKKGSEDIAMVEDFTGKGYVLTEGTKIGRRGVVKNIASKSVIVEETAVTRAGKKIVTEVVMLLKKEGEE